MLIKPVSVAAAAVQELVSQIPDNAGQNARDEALRGRGKRCRTVNLVAQSLQEYCRREEQQTLLVPA